MSSWRNSLILSAALFGVSLAILYFLGQIIGWDPLLNIQKTEYCEYSNFASWIRQPMNAISNYIYYLIGAQILLTKTSSFFSKHKLFKLSVGSTSILIGFTSMLFHGGYVAWTKTLDSSFVYAGALLLFVMLLRVGSKQKAVAAWYDQVVLVLFSLVVLTFLALNLDSIYFVLLIILASALVISWEKRNGVRFKRSYLIIAMVTFLLSFAVRQIDVSKAVCDPNSLIQLHALWHIGSAIGFWYLYKFLDSAKQL